MLQAYSAKLSAYVRGCVRLSFGFPREFRLHKNVLGRPESLSLSVNYQTADEDMDLVKLRTDVRVTLICNENESIKGIYFYVPNGTFLIF